MDIIQFKEKLESEILSDIPNFVVNMKNTNEQDHSFIEWLNIFISWMEWGSEEDYENFYGR